MIRLMPAPITRSASMSSPESVSSRMARRGSMIPICTISLRFFSPPEKPTFTARFIISMSSPSAALGVQGGPEELDVGDARYLDRILEAEEHALRRPLVRIERKQVPAVE